MAIRAVIIGTLLAGLAFGQSAPVPIFKPDPRYTDEARKAGIEGTVSVQALIDEQGIPRDPKVKRSLDKGLDEQAIETVKSWRFKPATSRDGKPISVAVTIEIVFKLPK
jgi:protein TonB